MEGRCGPWSRTQFGKPPSFVIDLALTLFFLQPEIIGGMPLPSPGNDSLRFSPAPSPPIKGSPPPSPILGPPIVSLGVIDLTLDDDSPAPPVLGKRSAPPVNYDDTYVDDDGTVHPPPDERPRKKTRARATSTSVLATPKVKGKGKAADNTPGKPKPRRPPVRKVSLPPLPEPHRARLSDLTTAQPQGLVSFFFFLAFSVYLFSF